MINHTRTLLLNLPSGVGDIYIPPAYGPVVVPPHFQKIRNAILTGSTNPDVLLTAVALWLPFLHNEDFKQFSDSLDQRITYEPAYRKMVNSYNSINMADMLKKVVSVAVQNAGVGKFGLFNPFGDYEDELLSLKKLWDVKKRSEERAVAAVYGYIYQLERIRLNA